MSRTIGSFPFVLPIPSKSKASRTTNCKIVEVGVLLKSSAQNKALTKKQKKNTCKLYKQNVNINDRKNNENPNVIYTKLIRLLRTLVCLPLLACVQRHALRAFCASSVPSLFTETNESPLEERRLKLSKHYSLKRTSGRRGMTRSPTGPVGLKVEAAVASAGINGPFTRYANLRVAHAPGMPGTFSPPPWVSDPNMHHGTCVVHARAVMHAGSLTSGFLWSRGGENVPGIPGACNPQFCIYSKRSMPIWFAL